MCATTSKTNRTASYMTHFPRTSNSHPYSVITPDTPLETLEAFFIARGVEFALGTIDGVTHFMLTSSY